MRLKSLCVLPLCFVACSSHSSQEPPSEFSGEHSFAVAFFETLVPSAVSVHLFDDYITCDDWQKSSQFNFVRLDVAANVPGQYAISEPASDGTLAGQADALGYIGSTSATGTSGSVVLSQVNNGSSLSGSGSVDWDDGESLIIDQFSATYCPAIPPPPSFQGTLTPQAAFFDNAAGTTGQPGYSVFLLSQTLDCSSWQQTNPPISSSSVILELDVYSTAAGTYSVVEAVNPGNSTATALISQGSGDALVEMDAASGHVTLSSINPNSTLAGSNLQIVWNDNTSLQVNAFNATYCPLSGN